MKKLTARRVSAGYYEVPTPHGTYRIEHITAPKASGAQSGWFVFRPTETMADTCRPTKREAMAYLHYICLADPDYKPGLEDVELASDAADREQARAES